MEFPFPFSLGTISIIFTILLSFFPILLWLEKKSNSRSAHNQIAPKVTGAWPIIGNLHLLLSNTHEPSHKIFGSLADKYGPIFSIRLGVKQVMVVSDSKLVKECLTTNDKVLANRPKSLVGEVMGYNYAVISLGPCGEYWRQIRKIYIREALSNRRIEMGAHVQASEVKTHIKDVCEYWTKNKDVSNMVMIDMKEWFGNMILSLVVRMVAGERYSPLDKDGSHFLKAMQRFMHLLGTFVVSDSVPYTRWLDLGGHEKEMRKTAKEMDDILEEWLKKHKRMRNLGLVEGKGDDFMDVMLAHVDGGECANAFSGFDGDAIVKANTLTLIAGGTDTTTVTLTWALSLLLNNPYAMKMAQDELDIHVGRERQVEMSDMEKLIYLQAIVKETLRLYPAAPLAVPHEALEDCVVGGYHVPKGTTVYVNIWKLQRDSNFWSDPDKFQPERFLTKYKDIELGGFDFEFIPFGSGRRICPGMSFGLHTVELVLANVLHAFEFRIATGESIDMSESIGVTNLKATPLEALVAPRLSYNIYG